MKATHSLRDAFESIEVTDPDNELIKQIVGVMNRRERREMYRKAKKELKRNNRSKKT